MAWFQLGNLQKINPALQTYFWAVEIEIKSKENKLTWVAFGQNDLLLTI